MTRLLLLLAALAPTAVCAQLTPVDFGLASLPSNAGIYGPADETGDHLLVGAVIDGDVAMYKLSETGAERLTDGGNASRSVALGELAFFLRYDSATQRYALWRTDGTESGTLPLVTIPGDPGYLATTADRLFFLVGNPGTGPESTRLWTSDGTPEGTRVVEDARPARTDGLRYVVTPADDLVYFSAENGSTLWQSDGETSTRVATFGEGGNGQAGAFFYGNALATGDEVYALSGFGSGAGLFLVDASAEPYGATLLSEVGFTTTNRSLVPFDAGVLFAAPTGNGATATFYTATPDGVEPVGLSLAYDPNAGPNMTTPLADGSVALVGMNDGRTEVWRLQPDGSLSLSIRLPEGETILGGAGAYDVPVGVRTKAAAVVADGVLYAVSQRPGDGEPGVPLLYTLWRSDGGDGSVVASDLKGYPTFGRAAGRTYVSLSTERYVSQLYVLGGSSVSTEPTSTVDALSLRIVGPNPARMLTMLRTTAPAGTDVRVEAFDVLGRRVAVLHDGTAPADALRFDVGGLPSGLYIIRARTATAMVSARLVVAS